MTELEPAAAASVQQDVDMRAVHLKRAIDALFPTALQVLARRTAKHAEAAACVTSQEDAANNYARGHYC